jgi:hypothetical protein
MISAQTCRINHNLLCKVISAFFNTTPTGVNGVVWGEENRINIELDLQSLFGLHVYSCTHWLRPHNSPAFGLIYVGAIGQPR